MFDLQTTSLEPKKAEREARYRLSGAFVRLIEEKRLGLQGRRLAHGLAHAICRETDDWHNGSALQPEGGYRTLCKSLRAKLGLEDANGNRDLAKGLEELQAARFLHWGEFTARNQWLDWRMDDAAFQMLFDPVPYGLFDIRDAGRLATPLDFLVYNYIGLFRRRRAPELTLSVAGCGAAASRSPDWSHLRPALLEALRKSAEVFGLKVLVVCECRGSRVGIDHVTLRLSHERTKWSAASLGNIPPTARRILAVDASGCRPVSLPSASALP